MGHSSLLLRNGLPLELSIPTMTEIMDYAAVYLSIKRKLLRQITRYLFSLQGVEVNQDK